MMPPSSHPVAPPTPLGTPMPWQASPVPADGAPSTHADYDLRPLTVEGLAHYVALNDEKDERFSVR